MKCNNIKLIIEYDGTRYSGWQRIPGKKTIQGEIEAGLSKILNENTRITGAGRTDAGVHALGQVANFKTEKEIDLNKLKNSLNKILPKDIVVKKTQKVSPDFHSRYSVKLKVYKYIILNSKTPVVFKRMFTLFYPHKLDLSSMRRAIKYLKGVHDFKMFSAKEKRKNLKMLVKDIKIKKSGRLINIYFYGRSFLHKMVRIIVGFLLTVGTGKYKPEDTKLILKGRLKFSPVVVLPHGLFLKEVKY